MQLLKKFQQMAKGVVSLFSPKVLEAKSEELDHFEYPEGFLSKTGYQLGRVCDLALWNKSHRVPGRPFRDAEMLCMQNGHKVGELAYGLFEAGTMIERQDNPRRMMDDTIAALKNGRPIYEATFYYASNLFEGDLVRVDILENTPFGLVLNEVKSTVDMCDDYLHDLAFQWRTMEKAGYRPAGARLIHINRDYRLEEGGIDPRKFFVVQEVTGAVEKLAMQVDEITEAMRGRMLQRKPPQCAIGRHCLKPRECVYKESCWSHVPNGSVLELSGNGTDKWKLWQDGYKFLRDVPDTLVTARGQQIQIRCEREHDIVFDADAVRAWLDKLVWPIASFDFETLWSNPIPLFVGTKPYEHVPFQYSLHVLDSLSTPPRHMEFLGKPGADPRRAITVQMIDQIPPEGSIVAYNSAFERARMRQMALWFPDLAPQIELIIDRLVDLMDIFRAKAVYCREMKGSYSVKVVLPALAPEMKYNGLEVKNGEEAGLAFGEMFTSSDELFIRRVAAALLSYCKLDTFALLVIIKRLYELLDEYKEKGGIVQLSANTW